MTLCRYQVYADKIDLRIFGFEAAPLLAFKPHLFRHFVFYDFLFTDTLATKYPLRY